MNLSMHSQTRILELDKGVLEGVLCGLRPADQVELMACIPPDQDFWPICSAGPAWGVTYRHQPAAAFGYRQRSIAVVEGWAFGTDRFTRIAPELTRFIQEDLRRTWLQAGIRVCEVRSIESNETAHAWLRRIGFRHAAHLANQGAKGEAFKLFAWDLANDEFA